MSTKKAVVTGAFGYSGKYITDKLLALDYEVVTLTNSPQRYKTYPSGLSVQAYNFSNPQAMAESIAGAEVFVNTYWIRMESSSISFEHAVENSKALLTAAKFARINRFIHISATNASLDSKAKYYRGKALVEEALINSGIPYSILRPAFLFGNEDVLVNNIAWMLRRLPAYPIFANGSYKVRPIHVEDLADLVIAQLNQTDNCIINAVGQKEYSYRDFIRAISDAVGCKRLLVSVPVWFGFIGSQLLGLMLNDVISTRDELSALVGGSLYASGAPIGKIHLAEWLAENGSRLGLTYRNERNRRRNLSKPYSEL